MTTIANSNFEISNNFKINGSLLDFKVREFPFKINSFPKKYLVSTLNRVEDYKTFLSLADFIIIDEQVAKIYPNYK